MSLNLSGLDAAINQLTIYELRMMLKLMISEFMMTHPEDSEKSLRDVIHEDVEAYDEYECYEAWKVNKDDFLRKLEGTGESYKELICGAVLDIARFKDDEDSCLSNLQNDATQIIEDFAELVRHQQYPKSLYKALVELMKAECPELAWDLFVDL
jgi:hypothetical protein